MCVLSSNHYLEMFAEFRPKKKNSWRVQMNRAKKCRIYRENTCILTGNIMCLLPQYLCFSSNVGVQGSQTCPRGASALCLHACLYLGIYSTLYGYIYSNNKHRKPRRFQAKFWCYLTYIRVVAATKHNRSCYVASGNTVIVHWTVYTMYNIHTVENIRGLISTISVLDTWGCLSSLDAWETNTRYKMERT
jgi:hypothetical protein